MKKYSPLIVLFLLTAACKSGKKNFQEVNPIVNRFGNQLFYRFFEPEDYKDVWYKDSTFGKYLKVLSLKPHGYPVHYYNGQVKPDSTSYAAVIDIPIGKKDLMQCADVIMYLWADYLYNNGRFSEIHFNFTNGFNAEYLKWQQGYRIKVADDDVSWVMTDTFNADRSTFLQFMEVVYTYAGTQSLEAQMQKVSFSDIRAGDVFIQPGSPGHAAIVVDVAYNKSDEIIFMLAQGFMPAQEIHILQNPNDPALSPWYQLDRQANEIKTPDWTFHPQDLRRFVNN